MSFQLKHIRLIVQLLIILVIPFTCFGQIEITLKNEFIERYKNRGIIETNFTVDKAHARPNPPSKDGDLHIAGRSPEIGLPAVAEIMNAKSQVSAVKAIHQAESTGESIALSGVWRLWCEHGGGTHRQGEPLSPFNTTNPQHVFEVHPVTRIHDINLLGSLKPIVGIKENDAEQAFLQYERTRFKIIPNSDDTTTLQTQMIRFNYVKFRVRLNESDQFIGADGTRFLFASVLDLNGEVLVFNRRMVFIKDSLPEKKVRNLKAGDMLTVLGIPRINLALVSYRLNHQKEISDILEWDLPYEMIIVGVFP